MSKENANRPGGKYTRRRRGFRVKSHYRARLARRGLRNSPMTSLSELRRKYGHITSLEA